MSRHASKTKELSKNLPIWHFGWTGRERVSLKTAYQRKNGNVMFSMKEFDESNIGSSIRIGEHTVKIEAYNGPRVDDDLVEHFGR